MEPTTATSARHERLYVLAQCVGWGGFTLAYSGLAQLNKGMALRDWCLFVATNLTGLLLSHFYRRWIHRRGWRQLGWTSLLPRVLASTLVLSLLWTLTVWPIYRYLGTKPDANGMSLTAIFAYSVFNGIWIYSLWSLLYFGYHIGTRYRRSELERAQLAAAVKEAELRALKSQINPHFIFNALNSLRALIDEEPARARQAVTQLANLLRYSLQSGQLEVVPFEEELRVANDYLALEQVRHEERLRLRLDIQPEALRFSLPPMLLQTLVENAVKYGISVRPEGGEIAIIARCDDEGLNLRVTNPGALDAAAGGARRDDSTGVGLRNAAERLRLLFGNKATLKLSATGEGLVTAEARIPQSLMKPPTLIPA
jgi:hypothetical protein